MIALTVNAVAEDQKAFLREGMNDMPIKLLLREGLIDLITHLTRGGGKDTPNDAERPIVGDLKHLAD